MNILQHADEATQITYLIENVDDNKVNYTDYILELNQMEEYDSYEVALACNRERTALAILTKEISSRSSLMEYFLAAIEHDNKACLKLILQHESFESLMDNVFSGEYAINEDGLIWVVNQLESLSVEFVYKYMSAGQEVVPKVLKAILDKLSKEDLEKAYKTHQECLKTGISYYGGDYLVWLNQTEIQELTDVFYNEDV